MPLELRPGNRNAIPKMSDVPCMNWVITRMSVWAELVYIKQFQIFGYVNKSLTRFVWFDTSKLLMFSVKVPEKNNLVRKRINHPK